jgi:hypothetical protein
MKTWAESSDAGETGGVGHGVVFALLELVTSSWPTSLPRTAGALAQRKTVPYPRHSSPEAEHLRQEGRDRSQRSRRRRQL